MGFSRCPERHNVAEETPPEISINKKTLFVPEITCFMKIKNIFTPFKTFYIEEIGLIAIFFELKMPFIGSALPLRHVCLWQGTSGVF